MFVYQKYSLHFKINMNARTAVKKRTANYFSKQAPKSPYLPALHCLGASNGTALEMTYCDLVSSRSPVSAAAGLYSLQPESAQWLVCE